MQVYVSTLNFGPRSLPQLMAELGRLPYSEIEISSGHPSGRDARDSVLNFARNHRASVILHNYAPPEPGGLLINLSEPDPMARAAVTDFLKSRIDLTRELGSDYYSFHGGYRVPYAFGVSDYAASQIMDRELALEIFVDALREVVTFAEERSVHIGIENHVASRGNEGNLILYDRDDFEIIFKGVTSDYLHVHLDVGHLKVTCESLELNPLAFVEAFQDKIMAVHLHDNDGKNDSHQPFGEQAWFLKQLSQLPRLRYACLETKTQGDEQRIRSMVELLRDL